jgi:hypothetical protein
MEALRLVEILLDCFGVIFIVDGILRLLLLFFFNYFCVFFITIIICTAFYYHRLLMIVILVWCCFAFNAMLSTQWLCLHLLVFLWWFPILLVVYGFVNLFLVFLDNVIWFTLFFLRWFGLACNMLELLCLNKSVTLVIVNVFVSFCQFEWELIILAHRCRPLNTTLNSLFCWAHICRGLQMRICFVIVVDWCIDSHFFIFAWFLFFFATVMFFFFVFYLL